MTTLTHKNSFFHFLSFAFHDALKKYNTFKLNHSHKKQSDSDFTYDLEAMKKAINSPRRKVPKSALESDESFDKWLND